MFKGANIWYNNKRGEMMKKLICLGLSLLCLSGCGSSLKKYSMNATDIGFDTVVSFNAYTQNEATFNKYAQLVKDEFKRYDKLFDKYKNYDGINNIKTINDEAGKKAVKVDSAIFDLLEISKKYDSLTHHQFDVTLGSVLNIWHDYREQGVIANQNNTKSSIPSNEMLESANTHSGWQHVQLNKKDRSVYIDDKNVSLDVGGNAKGYAVEKIAQRLEKEGLQHAILNGGGNVRLIGNKPESDAWSVGIQIPNLKEQTTDSLVSLQLNSSTSIVTSGDYQRYYMYEGKTMHHIIDPSTLQPARHSRAVSVVTKDSGLADILSTTLYTLSHKDGMQLIKDLKEKENIEVDALWIYDDVQPVEDGATSFQAKGYHIVVSDGLKDKIKK